MLRVFLCVSMIMVSLVVNAQNRPEDLFVKLTHQSGNSTLPYRLLKPASEEADSYPLVIFLHGAGERGSDNEAQLTHIADLFTDVDNRSAFPCYVLAPQCPAKSWWAAHNSDGSMKAEPTPPMKLVIELIDKIVKEYKIDQSRIYITGVSMGGFGVWDLLSRFPEKFAAAVPICGGADPMAATRIKHIPQWIFHGARDKVVHPNHSRRMVKALQQAGANPTYTEYPDVAHDSWVKAYLEPHLLPWLFRQKSVSDSAVTN